jgi:hypothetical protein
MATKKATTKKTTTKRAEAKKETLIGIVNTDQFDLNVRKAPGGEIVKTLPKGSKVEYLKGTDPDWHQLADGSGFVMASKIK